MGNERERDVEHEWPKTDFQTMDKLGSVISKNIQKICKTIKTK